MKILILTKVITIGTLLIRNLHRNSKNNGIKSHGVRLNLIHINRIKININKIITILINIKKIILINKKNQDKQ